MCKCVCVCVCECERVCVSVRERKSEKLCVCVCVCECVWEREKERKRAEDGVWRIFKNFSETLIWLSVFSWVKWFSFFCARRAPGSLMKYFFMCFNDPVLFPHFIGTKKVILEICFTIQILKRSFRFVPTSHNLKAKKKHLQINLWCSVLFQSCCNIFEHRKTLFFLLFLTHFLPSIRGFLFPFCLNEIAAEGRKKCGKKIEFEKIEKS